MGMVIHWELCKKLKFDRTSKRYMHDPASVLEVFDLQIGHLISVTLSWS